MKTGYQYVILLFLLLFLPLATLFSSAEQINDERNDVWLQEKNDQTKRWEWIQNNISDHSYIDVIEIFYEVKEDRLFITVNLSNFFNDTKIIGIDLYYGDFTAYQNASPNRYYRILYTTESNKARMTSIGFSFVVDRDLTYQLSEDNTSFQVNTTIPFNDDLFTLWGFVYEYNKQYSRNWIDFFPSEFEPTGIDFANQTDDVNDSNDSDDTDDTDQNQTNGADSDPNSNTPDQSETPGFEFIVLIIGILLIMLYSSQIRNKR